MLLPEKKLVPKVGKAKKMRVMLLLIKANKIETEFSLLLSFLNILLPSCTPILF